MLLEEEKEVKAAKETAREAVKYLTDLRSSSTWEDCFLDGLQKGIDY